jgi:leucyl aminopeptidase (aminopeptidase T)
MLFFSKLTPLASSLASLAVNTCLRIRSNDTVTITFNEHFIRLAEDLAIECFKNGADVLLNEYTDRYYLGYLTHLSKESLREPSVWCRELTRNSTAQFWLGAIFDPAAFRKIWPEKLAADAEGENIAHSSLRKKGKIRTLLINLGKVTKPRAKAYGLDYGEFQRMMSAASRVDPNSLRKKGKKVAAKLQGSDRVHITSPNGTDLQLSVKGRKAIVNDAIVDEQDMTQGAFRASIPDGSVEIAVVENSANGKVVLDVPTPMAEDLFLPTPWVGRMIRELSWTFHDGRVTSFEGDKNAEALREEWEAFSGDKDRIAILSVGLNPRAKLGFLVNRIVEGAVGIAIGGNMHLGGVNRPGFSYVGSIARATFEVEGAVLVENGKLKLRH